MFTHVKEYCLSDRTPHWLMYANSVKSVKDAGASLHYKFSCTKTKGLNGQPEAEDKESFQIGNRWFKPNYHAHVVFDWMNHETGKSRKLNDEDMATMQTLASDILLMERGQSKAVTGKEHLERNDFIIEKQKAELQRIEETKLSLIHISEPTRP